MPIILVFDGIVAVSCYSLMVFLPMYTERTRIRIGLVDYHCVIAAFEADRAKEDPIWLVRMPWKHKVSLECPFSMGDTFQYYSFRWLGRLLLFLAWLSLQSVRPPLPAVGNKGKTHLPFAPKNFATLKAKFLSDNRGWVPAWRAIALPQSSGANDLW
mgnify:CR=1 FL=1